MQSCVDSVPVPLRTGFFLREIVRCCIVLISRYDAPIVGMIIRVSEQRSESAFLRVVVGKTLQVNVKHDVSIEQQERFCELVPQYEERTCCSQRLRLGEVLYLYAEVLTVSEIVHDFAGQVRHCDYQVIETLRL